MSFVDFRGNSLHVSVDDEICFRNVICKVKIYRVFTVLQKLCWLVVRTFTSTFILKETSVVISVV